LQSGLQLRLRAGANANANAGTNAKTKATLAYWLVKHAKLNKNNQAAQPPKIHWVAW
jgi:hypothetical protein